MSTGGTRRVLTRRFVRSMFDLGFLSETGAASFTRMIVGTCAMFLSFALLLIQVYAVKYLHLTGQPMGDVYRAAAFADHAFLIGIPMWIVAFVTILVGHSLFPDETDFRILGAMPIPRRVIFEARALAVLQFTGIFIAAAHLALLPVFLVVSSSPRMQHAVPVQLAAHWVASLLAAWFAALLVMAIHGVLLLVMPASRSPMMTAAIRSAMLCGLILVLPFLVRLPAHASDFAERSAWLSYVPPVWFFGIERAILGDVRFAAAAWIALPAFVVVLAASAACYGLLYRHFERVVLRRSPGAMRRSRAAGREWTPGRTPVFRAIETFTTITLRRSALHQGIVVVLSAIGVGLAVNSLLDAGVLAWAGSPARPSRALIGSAIWTPFALIFVMLFAVRTALLVPFDVRANWIFRVAEQADGRADQLRAGAWTVARLGIVVPALLSMPVVWPILGSDGVLITGVAVLCGFVFHAALMEDWSRIPFTCSYLPGKNFLPQIVITGIVSFALFGLFGTSLARATIRGSAIAWGINAALVVLVVALHRHRVTMWRDAPIDYEDELPTEARSLKLQD